MAMIASPNVNDDLKQKTLLQLLTSDESEATKLAADLIQTDSDGKIPFSSDILHRLLADLHPDNPNAVTKILKSSGRALLVSAAPDTISELEKHLQEDKSLNHLFGVSGDTLVSVIKEIGEQGGPNAQEVQEWLIKASLSEALIENNTGFIDYLKAGKLTRESCGQDIDWAVQTFKEAVETSKNKYTGWSANSNPTLDEAAMWLLTGNTSTYDEAVLQGIKAKIKSWKWNADLLDAVLERCPGLSDAWKKKLKKAAK
jgi:hypothetical protein